MIDRLTDAAEDCARENRTQNGHRQTLVEKGRAHLMVAMNVHVLTVYSKHMERYEIFTLPGSSPNGCTTNRL